MCRTITHARVRLWKETGGCTPGSTAKPGNLAGRVVDFQGHISAGLMTTLTQKPSLSWHLSSKSKQDDQEGGQRAASYQCSQQSLAPGESHTGHLARPWWMHMLCLHWHCRHSSACPERNHALCFSCSLWPPLWEVQPQLHFGNNLPAPTQKPSTLSQTMAENLQSCSSPSTCPQFKLPGAEGCLEPEMALGTYMRLLGVSILHPSV